MDIDKFDYIYNETIKLDHDTTVGLSDVCGMVPTKSTILKIVRIMDTISNIDHSKLFEEAIAIFASQEGRIRGDFFNLKSLLTLFLLS